MLLFLLRYPIIKCRMQVFIYGSQNYAKLVGEIAMEAGYSILGFLDDFSGVSERTYAHSRARIIGEQIPVFLGIGYKDLRARAVLLEKLRQDNVNMPNLIHPRSYVHSSVVLGVGNVFMAGSFVDAFASLGNGNVLWPHAMISHDSRVGSNTFFSPKALACGFCNIGSNVFVGAGSIIVDHVTVPDDCFVKAASLVKKS